MWKKFFDKLNLTNSLKRPDFKINIDNGTGLQEIEPKPEDFVLGSNNQALKIILSEDKDYTEYLPIKESQNRGYDCFSCVVFSGLNCLEIIYKKLYGEEINFADRFPAGMIPVVPYSGTSYAAFWDEVRDSGLVLEEDYPWGGSTPEEYVKRPPQNIIDRAKIFLNEYDIQHEWVDWGGCEPNKLYEAIKYGPIQASVNAGATINGSYNTNSNHSITIYGVEKGKKFKIFDHYSRSNYELPWNFYFGSAKLLTLNRKKKRQIVQIPFLTNKEDAAKLYAIYGSTACHIADEFTWIYGTKLGIWEKNKIIKLTENTFNNRFTIGKQIKFK